MTLLELGTLCAIVLLAGAALLWVVSLIRRDASIVDSFWGPAFALVALLGAVSGGGALPRRILLLALTSIWGLRLGFHIHRRNREAFERTGEREDYRYRAMRARHDRRFAIVSLFTVFVLQALLALLVAAPLLVGASAPWPATLGILDLAGVALWLVGFLFEAIGDAQLARFRRDPANRGQVMDRGLWRTTRHPNYFGDATLWWGLWLIAAASAAPGAPAAYWSAIGPLAMTVLLVRVSGKALLEKGLAASKPGYREYVERTSGFVPWFPKSSD